MMRTRGEGRHRLDKGKGRRPRRKQWLFFFFFFVNGWRALLLRVDILIRYLKIQGVNFGCDIGVLNYLVIIYCIILHIRILV